MDGKASCLLLSLLLLKLTCQQTVHPLVDIRKESHSRGMYVLVPLDYIVLHFYTIVRFS